MPRKDNLYWGIMFIIYFCILVCYVKPGISTDNYIYAVEELHMYDSNLYKQNPAIVTNTFTPRFLDNFFVSTIMKVTNISWEAIIIILRYITVLIYTFMVYLFSRYLFRKKYAGIILSLLLALNVAGGLAGFHIYEVMNVFMGLACSLMGIALFCILYGYMVKDNTKHKVCMSDIAWILAAFAMCIHVHEGLYGGALLFITIIAGCIYTKKIYYRKFLFFPLYIFATVICVLPNMIKDTTTWDNADFVEVYATLRHPWHLVPSSWGAESIIYHIILVIIPFLLISCNYFIDKKFSKDKIRVISAVYIFSYILALLTMYIFTEVIPVGFISTLFISKYFKYVSLIGCLIYLYLIVTQLEKNAFFITIFIFTIVAISVENLFQLLTWKVVLIVTIGIFICILQKYRNGWIKVVSIMLLLSIFLFALEGHLFYYDNSLFRMNSAQNELRKEATEDIYFMGQEFKCMTDKDEVFLIDPYDNNGGWFQLISNRSAYTLWKTVPSSKKSIEIWYDRILQTKEIASKTTEDVREIMKETECEYIFIPKERYEIYDTNNAEFQLILSSDTYRLYKCKK